MQTKEQKAASQKRWYEKNRVQHRQNVARRNQEVIKIAREYIKSLKESVSCADCDKYYPSYVMDFDHLENKEYQIGTMVNQAYSLNRIKAEIAKCEIVCSNCHRVRTHDRASAISSVGRTADS